MTNHSRNFDTPLDQILELSSLLKLAKALDVNLHVNWDKRYPHRWELDFIENAGSQVGGGSHVLKLLTDAADLHRKEIIGFVQNMSDSRLPPDEWLLVWYEKHGFIRIFSEKQGVHIKRRHAA